MLLALLYIRLKQLYRSFKGGGIFRFIFFICLVVFLGVLLFQNMSDKTISQYITLSFIGLILYIHLKRADKVFLKSHFANYKTLMFAEYIVLSIPVLVCILLHKQWISLLYFSALPIIVHLDIKTKYSSLNTKLQKLIPSDAFEWKAGLRKQFFILVPLWVIAAVTSFFIGSVPIAILIFGVAIISYFEKCEPYQILLSYELNAKKLIQHKIKRQIQLFSIITIPLIGLFLLFHANRWYIPLAEYAIFCFIHIYMLLTKYAFYESNKNTSAPQAYGIIGMFGFIFPIFLPVVWLLSVLFYKKSIKKLNFYLNDYN